MKALTLWQPWASLVAHGFKKFETRSWGTAYRGPLAIHSAKKEPGFVRDWLVSIEADGWRCAQLIKKYMHTTFDELPRGAVLCYANLTDVILIRDVHVSKEELLMGDWTLGRYAWKLEDVVRLERPVPARGHKGLWEWDNHNDSRMLHS